MEYTNNSYYLVGIGGMGMTPLALFLRQMGCQVRGWDDDLHPLSQELLDKAGIVYNELANEPGPGDCVIYSSAIRRNHPKRALARHADCLEFRRGEFIAELAKSRRLIAVVGSHGKTTTTAMIIWLLRQQHVAFEYILGGFFRGNCIEPAKAFSAEKNISGIEKPFLVVEVDESDGTIDLFTPEILVITNSDWDHPSHYPSPEAYRQTFKDLMRRTRVAVVIPGTDPLVGGKTEERSDRLLLTVGTSPGAVYEYHRNSMEDTDGTCRQKLDLSGRFKEQAVTIPMGGAYNAENAALCCAAVDVLGAYSCLHSLEAFPGIFRRQELLYRSDDFIALADYAHHPREIQCFLHFAREQFPDKRCVLVFQPHRYSRTAALKADFAKAFSQADDIHLLDTYSAGEGYDDKGDEQALYDVCRGLPVRWPKSTGQLFDGLACEGLNGKVICFLGAGDIYTTARLFPSMASREAERLQWWNGVVNACSGESRSSEHERLDNKTTYRVGGKARFYIEPASVDDLQTIIRQCTTAGEKYYLLGRGTNTLVPDTGFNGVVVRQTNSFWNRVVELEENRLEVGAGVRLKQLSGEACKRGLEGFEFMEGIPGCIGGALRMNAGAMGTEIFDLVESVSVVRRDGKLVSLPRSAFNPVYRSCREIDGCCVVSAILRASGVAESDTIRERINTYSQYRRKTQPREKSAGCAFQNPDIHPAGWLIDKLGFKGLQVGGASVSQVHANFIVNQDRATSNDIIGLVKTIHAGVKRHHGIELRPEVILLGLSWDELL